MAQYGGGGGRTGGGTGGGTSGSGTSGGGATAGYNFNSTYHVGFDRPEPWGLKYLASASLLNGLQPPESAEEHRFGSITVGFEVGWLPTLDAGQGK